MRRLAGALEILDGPLPDEAALVGNLRDLRRTNRWLWGASLSLRAVDELLDRAPTGHAEASVLDVGTGSADVPLALLEHAGRRGQRLSVVATDARPEVLDAARRLDPSLDERPGLVLRVADGARLPFADGAFHVAHCSLLLHHVDPDLAIGLLTELRRVASVGVVVNDLLRSWPNWIGARVLVAVATRNPLTRNDGPLSVRRAYTEREIRSLLDAAGLRPLVVLRDPLRQRVAIAAETSTA